MVKSKVVLSLVTLILTAALVLSGCNSHKPPQEALKASMVKSAEMKSYSFKGSMKVEELSFTDKGGDPAATAAVLSMFKDSDLTWTGVYQADPMHMELKLALALKGDMAVNFNIPIIMEKDKMWVKIPNIPFLPLPENLKDKFLELDLKKMAEDAGQPIPNIDPGKSQKFINDVLAIIFNNVDEKQYLSEVKVKDAGLPADADVKQVVRFQVNKDQVEPFVKTVMDKIAPEVLDLLSKNAEYRTMLGLKPEDVDKAKADLDKAKKEDLSKGMDEFKKAVKSLDVTSNIGIDAKEYPVYTDLHLKAVMDMDGESGTIALKVVSETKDINKEVKLEYPNGPKDVITMKQFQEQMGGLFGGGLGDSTDGSTDQGL